MKNNRQNTSVFAKSRDALTLLLKTKSFDAISTKEIAQTAGFSRQYFYRFYKDKMDLLFDIFEADLSGSLDGFYRPGKSSVTILDTLLKNQFLYKALFESSFSGEAIRMLRDTGVVFVKTISKSSYIRSFGRDEEEDLIFYLNAVVQTIIDVVKNGKQYNREELSRLFYKNVPISLEYLKGEIITMDVIIYQIEKYKVSLRQ